MLTPNPQLAANIEAVEAEIVTLTAQKAAAQEHADNLKARRDALTAERGQIITSRTIGLKPISDDAQGHRLALIVADIEGLSPLITAAERAATAVDVQSAERRLQSLKAMWTQNLAEIEVVELRSLCAELEEKYLAAVAQLHESCKVADGQSRGRNWRPGNVLRSFVENQVVPPLARDFQRAA